MMNAMRQVALFAVALAACLGTSGVAGAAEETTTVAPGEIRSYATIHSIGVEWDVTGDANHNAACAVQYRGPGAGPWKEALPLFRIDYQGWYGSDKADRRYNMLAGSVMFLQPDTTYEVKLALSDPDGGAEGRTLRVRTKPEPSLPRGGRTLHVVPGAGGGDGSERNPFQGLAAAQAAARAADILLLHAGSYGSFAFSQGGEAGRYLVWKAAGDGEAVFAKISVSASHVWLEGLTLNRGAESPNGLVAEGAREDVVVTRNRFKGFHYSITLNKTCREWYITDNVIVGDKQKLDTSDIDGEGIELNHSADHVVAYNRISNTADGVSYALRNCDIYGNDIRDVTDDGIEPDYGYANIRIWGNRICRAFNEGVSFQPMYCGPWYIVRNEIVTLSDMLKPNVVDRFVLVNNTLVVHGRYAQGHADILLQSLSRNNLWILINNRKEPSYAIMYAGKWARGEKYSMAYQPLPDWKTDVDYDGFDWDQTPTPFWWEVVPGKSVQYRDLHSFSAAVGIETHGVHVKKEDIFEAPDIMAYAAAPYSAKRLVLKKNCNAIDTGAPLPNICEAFEGKAPDLGAYEFGKPTPHYGPRP